jgi:hypothetical protein
MKWFKHYTDAHDNNKLTKLRIKFGAKGYAVYWYCLEIVASTLGENQTITFELKQDAEVIGHNLNIDSRTVEEIMHFMVTLNLFEINDNVITCLKLAKYLDSKNTRNIVIHKIIKAAKKEISAICPPTVRDSPRQSATVPRQSPDCPPPDTDTDTDTDNRDLTRSIDPGRKKTKRFAKPTIEEIKTYILENNLNVDGEKYYYFYESKNWYIGKNKMVSWKSALHTWNTNKKNGGDNGKIDNRTRAKRLNDKLKQDAQKDIEENGFAPFLD